MIVFPWFNRQRPFIALHWIFWGYRRKNNKDYRIYHWGLQLGRQFMPSAYYHGWIKWFDLVIPEWLFLNRK